MNKRLLHAAQVVLTEPVEAEGTEIELHDTVNAPLKGLQVYGRSAQRTTKGTNLCDWRNYPTTEQNGVTITADEYGVVTVSGTPTVENKYIFTYHNYISDFSLFEVGKTYYCNEVISIQYEDRIVYCKNFVFDESMKKISTYIQRKNNSYIDGEIIKPVLSEGSLAEWEPYTGGAPSPSPDYPQEIVSVGDVGNIEVNISGDRGQDIKSAVLETPTGLPGIPVSSGGNYTDADGQQWVCDEVDFARGVYVRRVYLRHYDPSEYKYSEGNKYNLYTYDNNDKDAIIGDIYGMSNVFTLDVGFRNNYAFRAVIAGVRARVEGATSVNDLKSMIPNGFDVLVVRKTPTETPLSAAELAAYKSLHSNYTTTIITNSEDAHMKVNCLKIRGGGYKLLSLLFLQRRWCYA